MYIELDILKQLHIVVMLDVENDVIKLHGHNIKYESGYNYNIYGVKYLIVISIDYTIIDNHFFIKHYNYYKVYCEEKIGKDRSIDMKFLI